MTFFAVMPWLELDCSVMQGLEEKQATITGGILAGMTYSP